MSLAQVLGLLSNSAGIEVVSAALTYYYPWFQHVVVVALRLDKVSNTWIFFRLMVVLVMTGDKHDLIWRFTKMKPLVYYDTESDDASSLLIVMTDSTRWKQ